MAEIRCFVFLLILQLIVSVCSNRLIIKRLESERSPNLVDAAVKIFKSCYEKRVKTIGIVGDSQGKLINSISSDESFAVVLLGNAKVNNGPVKRESRYPLGLFAITVSSSKELGNILVGIKNSQWWNHMANFYIIDWPTTENGCSRAYEILRTAWKMDILEAKFMCTHPTKGRLIYTFNPYTSDAPKPWKLEKIHRGKNDHPWALLIREYRENHEICDKIDFDKTTDLGGYEIRSGVGHAEFKYYTNVNATDINNSRKAKAIIGRTVFHALNATPKFLRSEHPFSIGYIDKKGKPHGVVADLVNGNIDLELSFRDLLAMRNLTSVSSVSTHLPWLLVIFTQPTGQKSQLTKLVSLIDNHSRIGLCLVLFVTLIFLKCFVRQTLGQSALNIIRIICNAAITNVPNNLPSRIYLTSLFLLMITIQGIYQGKLSSILTKPERLDNINTMLDLAKSNHTIYGVDYLSEFFNDPSFNYGLRFVGINRHYCVQDVRADPMIACICEKYFLLYYVGRYKLHVSKEPVSEHDFHWPIRENWPLQRRLSMVFTRLFESHFIQRTLDTATQKRLREIEANEQRYLDDNFKVLTLADLSFAFVILAIGLGCATIVFILEIIIGRVRKIHTRNLLQNFCRNVSQLNWNFF